MNQILQVQENKNKNSKSLDIKKVILFFAISIIVFGVIFVGKGGYAVYHNKINQKVNSSTSRDNENPEIPEYVTNITFTKTEDNKVIINVESEIAISNIIYNWNNEATQTIDESGKTNIEEILEIPIGENILHVSVIDSNGKETKKSSETYIIEESKPVIDIKEISSVTKDKINIKIVSEAELSYITYRWNTDTEERIDMNTFEDKNKFERSINVPKGINTFKIVAVDVNNNKAEKTEEIKRVDLLKDPYVYIEGEYIHFVFESDDYMKSVEMIFNGKKSFMDTSTFGQTKKVHYKFKLISGWNYLKLIGITENDTVNTTVWKQYKE